MKQAARRRHPHQRSHAHAAGRLAEDRHVVGIATELRDIVADPLERRDLIEHPLVARGWNLAVGQFGQAQETQRTEPIIDRHDHNIAPARERGAVVNRGRARTHRERAAVNPDHHGTPRAVESGRPYIQIQAVLVPRLDRTHAGKRGSERGRRRILRRGLAERLGGSHAGPRRARLRRHPAARAGRRSRKRDTLEDEQTGLFCAFQFSGSSVCNRRHDRCSTRWD